MSTRILSITVLLLSVLCLCFRPSAGRGPGKSLQCCNTLSTANIGHRVMGETYRVQNETIRCVKAVIFATPDGTVCVDPNADWVKKLTAEMRKV